MSMPEIASRVFHTPLLVTPAKAKSFVAGLGPRILGVSEVAFQSDVEPVATPSAAKPFASILDGRLSHEIRMGERDGYALRDGVALIAVAGSLVHRGAWVGSSSGQVSYEGVSAQIEAACMDHRVKSIALEIDSHGGEVAGLFSLAKQIRKARTSKKVFAFVADHAFSAGYAIAAQADRIIMPEAGGVGSIGVICLHADHSQQLSDAGINVTVISAGERKADGNPYEPLPDDVRSSLEGEMQQLRQIFAENVAAGRNGAIDLEGVLSTEAATYLGAEAVKVGLADEVAEPAEAFEEFISETNGRSGLVAPFASNQETKPMSKTAKTTNPSAEEQATDQIDETTGAGDEAPAAGDDTPAPAAETNSTPSASVQTPAADAAKDEHDRVMGILTCAEAEGKEELARSLAGDRSMSLEQAKKHLAAAASAAPQRQLSAEMEDDDADLDTSAGAVAPANLAADAVKALIHD
ncbi:S49 family peptidase [Thalassovita sp.]|uniref:S49 family peptidase n=1 Tax=Thalassovita sp. TaxID=1979401 RepID=UPI002AB164C4|nr:S49 family peptidase [Thalassovita sp.]